MTLLAVGFSVLFLATLAALDHPSAAQSEKAAEAKNELVVGRADKDAVPLKAELGDVWKGAKPLTVNVYKENQSVGQVELRAIFDGYNLYVMAQWADTTKSDTKKAWEFRDGQWTKRGGDEDRLSIAWGISSDAFREKGCTALCHTDGKAAMKCPEDSGKVDLWHWKAARGGQAGWCDDQVITREKRGDDKGQSAYKANVDANDAQKPGWRWADKADRSGIFNEGNAVALDADYKPAEGEVLPSHVLRKPNGSRGDVRAFSSYADGKWTVLLVREDGTGNDDDFRLGSGRFPFAVALFDDTGSVTGDEHAKSKLCWLVVPK
jgi:hypothetical protein